MSFLFEPENLLPYDGIAIYHGVVFDEQEANGIFKDLFATIPWKQDEVVMFGKKIITKRKVAWYADAGITYAYAGVKKSGLEWTFALNEIRQKVEAITGAKYNACLLNLYHEGEEGMGWHQDNEVEMVAGSSIASRKATVSSVVISFVLVSGFILATSIIFLAEVRPIPCIYVRAYAIRLFLGKSTPTNLTIILTPFKYYP